MSEAFDHHPVMRDEITAAFSTVPAGTIVDATLGGGGHSAALVDSRAERDAALAVASRSIDSDVTEGFANHAARNESPLGSRMLWTLNQAVPSRPMAATAR